MSGLISMIQYMSHNNSFYDQCVLHCKVIEYFHQQLIEVSPHNGIAIQGSIMQSLKTMI